MNVLFLTHAFPRFAGDAAGSFILRLAVALRAEGIVVHVAAPAAVGLASPDVVDGIPVHRLRYAPASWETLAYEGTMVEQVRRSWKAKLALAGLIASEGSALSRLRRETSAAVVHAHWWFPNGLAAATHASARAPLVTTFHGSDIRLARSTPLARRALAWVTRRSAAVTAVSSWLADEAGEMVPGLRATVAPMPVDVDRFTPPGARERDRLLFVGRLNEQKGVERLLAALTRVRRSATLDIVGGGEEQERLQSAALRLGVAERVRWHGAQPYPSLPSFYRRATALIVPSHEEGLGLVAAEAALCGTPVVAFDSGGVRDLVLHERTGILVRPTTEESLAAAIEEILDRPDQGASLGTAGRVHALDTVAPAAVARRYADIYRSVALAR